MLNFPVLFDQQRNRPGMRPVETDAAVGRKRQPAVPLVRLIGIGCKQSESEDPALLHLHRQEIFRREEHPVEQHAVLVNATARDIWRERAFLRGLGGQSELGIHGAVTVYLRRIAFAVRENRVVVIVFIVSFGGPFPGVGHRVDINLEAVVFPPFRRSGRPFRILHVYELRVFDT